MNMGAQSQIEIDKESVEVTHIVSMYGFGDGQVISCILFDQMMGERTG